MKKSIKKQKEIVIPACSLELQSNGMKEVRQSLEYELLRINQWIATLEEALEHKPEGTVRISRSGNRVQCFHILDPKDKKGSYIKKKDMELAFGLAQKGYDQRLLAELLRERKAIQQAMDAYKPERAELLYAQMNETRRNLIVPRVMDDNTFAAMWSAAEFAKKPFGTYSDLDEDCLITENGESVRSKSELIIANELQRMGIPYRYECALNLRGMGTIHPDFTILKVSERREIYWEHLGMMDDRIYYSDALARVECYERNGYFPGKSLILSHETSRKPLSVTVVKSMIREYILN